MGVIILIAVLLVVLVSHEGGHAYFMWRKGIEIKQAGIGLHRGPKITFRIPGLPFPVTLSPILIGAYVEPSKKGEEQLKNLPYRDKALIFGAGAVINLATGLIAAGTLLLYREFVMGLEPLFPLWPAVGITFGVGLFMLIFQRFTSCYLVPVIGISLLVLLIYSLAPAFIQDFTHAATHGGAAPGEPSGLVGPIGIFRLFSHFQTLAGALFLYALLAVNIGLLNMLPLHPFDGGKIIAHPIERLFGEVGEGIHNVVSTLFIVALLFLVFANDIGSLLPQGGG